jgi:hypothetical protein
MFDTDLEVKLPQDLIDIIPQERITGDILRGHGPRRGNLEALLKYWRPIMRKSGGFRRCIVILANHPELYPLQRICAWLHHETTGKWPNEGNHHGGGSAARVAGRVARRAVPGKRKRRRKSEADGGVEIAGWRLYRRLSRMSGGISTRPIGRDLNAVEYKAARFRQGHRSIPMPGSFDWDEEFDWEKEYKEKVGLVNSHGRMGRWLQSMASFFIPGDMGKLRSPVRAAVYGALTPGGGGAGGRGGIGGGDGLRSIGGAAMRCPSGYQNGGRFAEANLRNCGGVVFDVPGKGPGAVTAADRSKLTRRFEGTTAADYPDVVRDVVAKKPKGDPFAVVRAAAMPGKTKPNIARRDSAVADVVEFAGKNRNTTRVVRRDGVVFEPRATTTDLLSMADHDNMREAVYVTSRIKSGSIAGEEIRLLTKGAAAIEYVYPEGSVRVVRKGAFSEVQAAKMRTRWAGIQRDPEILTNPHIAIEKLVKAFPKNLSIESNFKDIPDAEKRIVVYTVGGDRTMVPKWVFTLYLSERAPRRVSGKPAFYLAPPTARYGLEKALYWRPERDEYAALFAQQKALALRADPIPGRKRNVSDIRISQTSGLNKDSLIDIKAARFDASMDDIFIAFKVFGRRGGIGGRLGAAARRAPKVVPYNPRARDADNDGLVQEGTIWERPSGALFRGLAAGARKLAGSVQLVDANGKNIDYKPGDHDRSPLRQPAGRLRGVVGRGAGAVQRGQRDRIHRRDRELGAEVDFSELERRRLLRRANRRRDRLVQEINRIQGREEGEPQQRREGRADRRDRRAERLERLGERDVGRADELADLRQRREAFDADRRELEERQRQEREEMEGRDPRGDRGRERRDRRGVRRDERRQRIQEGAERIREGQAERIRERDREMGAEVDFDAEDGRRDARRERRAARGDRREERRNDRAQRVQERMARIQERQQERIRERDEAAGAEIDWGRDNERIAQARAVAEQIREIFDRRGEQVVRDEDEERIKEVTGKSREEIAKEIATAAVPEVLTRTDEDDAAIGQTLINLIPEEESLPDDRSRRNVRNRFQHRLPERAFWRESGWDPGGDRDRDADIAEHEDRFGRYYDDEGRLNVRGRVVNEQLRAERAGKPMVTERAPVVTPPRWEDDKWERRKGIVAGMPVNELEMDLETMKGWPEGERGREQWIALVTAELDRRRAMGATPIDHDLPPGENRDIGVVMAERFPVRPADMSARDIEQELLHIEEWKPDPLERPFLLGQRHEELLQEFDAMGFRRGEALPTRDEVREFEGWSGPDDDDAAGPFISQVEDWSDAELQAWLDAPDHPRVLTENTGAYTNAREAIVQELLNRFNRRERQAPRRIRHEQEAEGQPENIVEWVREQVRGNGGLGFGGGGDLDELLQNLSDEQVIEYIRQIAAGEIHAPDGAGFDPNVAIYFGGRDGAGGALRAGPHVGQGGNGLGYMWVRLSAEQRRRGLEEGAPDLLPPPRWDRAAAIRSGAFGAMDVGNLNRASRILLDVAEGFLDPVIDGVVDGDKHRLRELVDHIAGAAEGSALADHPRAGAVLAALRNRLVVDLDRPLSLDVPADTPTPLSGLIAMLGGDSETDIDAVLHAEQVADRVWDRAQRIREGNQNRVADLLDAAIANWEDDLDRGLDPGNELAALASAVDQLGLLGEEFDKVLDLEQEGTLARLFHDGELWAHDVPVEVLAARTFGQMLISIEDNLGQVNRPELLKTRLNDILQTLGQVSLHDPSELIRVAKDVWEQDRGDRIALRRLARAHFYGHLHGRAKQRIADPESRIANLLESLKGDINARVIDNPLGDVAELPIAAETDVFLREVVSRMARLRLSLVENEWHARGRMPLLGWAANHIDEKELFGRLAAGGNLTAIDKTRMKDMVGEMFSLGSRRSWKGRDGYEWRIVGDRDEDIPELHIEKTHDGLFVKLTDAVVEFRSPETIYDGEGTEDEDILARAGEWTQPGAGSTVSRSLTFRFLNDEVEADLHNDHLYVDKDNKYGVKGKGMVTFFNHNTWMHLQAVGGNKVDLTAVLDGKVVWGMLGFNKPYHVERMIQVFGEEIVRYEGGVESIVVDDVMRDAMQRLIGAYGENRESVTVMHGHGILGAAGRHPWRNVKPFGGVAGADGEAANKYGAWWVSKVAVDSGDLYLNPDKSDLGALIRDMGLRLGPNRGFRVHRDGRPGESIAGMNKHEIQVQYATYDAMLTGLKHYNMPISEEFRARHQALGEALGIGIPEAVEEAVPDRPLGSGLERRVDRVLSLDNLIAPGADQVDDAGGRQALRVVPTPEGFTDADADELMNRKDNDGKYITPLSDIPSEFIAGALMRASSTDNEVVAALRNLLGLDIGIGPGAGRPLEELRRLLAEGLRDGRIAKGDAPDKRFFRIDSRAITSSRIYFLRDADGNPTVQGVIVKNADTAHDAENFRRDSQSAEVIGMQLAGLMGFAWGGTMANGRHRDKPVIVAELGGSIADVNSVVTFDAFIDAAERGQIDTPKVIRGRLENVLLNFSMAAGDRHGENSMVLGDGEGILPIDFGRAFDSGYVTLPSYLANQFTSENADGGFGGSLNLGKSIKEAIDRGELTREEVQEWITDWTFRMRQALLVNWDSIIKDAELLHNSGGVSLSSGETALFNQVQRNRKSLMDKRLDHLEGGGSGNGLDMTEFMELLIEGELADGWVPGR